AILPATLTVCAGATARFTNTVSGPVGGEPYTVIWSGPNGFSQVNSGLANGGQSVIVIANAQAVNAGTYTAIVTNRFGCTNTCAATLTVTPNPTCTITPAGPFCTATVNTHTSAVLPADGTVTHSWSITGNGTIQGSTTGASVSVLAGAAGTYTLTDNITRD